MDDIEKQIAECEQMADERLTEELFAAVCHEREDLVRVLIRLGEFTKRDISTPKGYATVYDYCMSALGYSRSAAARRIAAATAGKRFPSMLHMIQKGELHLSGAAMIARHLTSENHRALLRRATGASQDEIASLVAGLSPGAARRDSIRVLAVAPTAEKTIPEESPQFAFESPSTDLGNRARTTDGGATAGNDQASAPARQFHRVSFDASEETVLLLRRAQELLRHRHPKGELDGVLNLALRRLLAEEDREQRMADGSLRGRRPGSRRSRYIPETVKNAVWKRDGGRCAFIGEDGRLCGARAWLEFDHVRPFALGGESDRAENVRLLCRRHNQFEAAKIFGNRM